ncbi:MAG: hypothetical protein GY722_28430 [bacterium]|nr:hypothetical protein [bacterium]
MYKYEGLGSIYWHMVAKLLLAVQESFWSARSADEPERVQRALADAYYRIRSGLSSDKTPTEYGAFPTDPYSHSPAHMGAQQPGMTGQVKEEILTRWGELGLRVAGGQLSFDPILLRSGEFLQEGTAWSYYDITGAQQTIDLPPQSLGFTYCQVPIIYKLGDPGIIVTRVDGSQDRVSGATLDHETSDAVFRRLGTVARIEVSLDQLLLVEDGRDGSGSA